MLAKVCWCTRPRVFADESDTCHRCGHLMPAEVTASTSRLALVIAEVVLGYRRVGDGRGQYERGSG